MTQHIARKPNVTAYPDRHNVRFGDPQTGKVVLTREYLLATPLREAAPDMLEALRGLLDLHIAHHNQPAHAAARAAIAKATGEASHGE